MGRKDSVLFRRKRIYWGLNKAWTVAFFTSHIFGWVTAFLQTFWIVYEIREKLKNKSVVGRNELDDGRRSQS